MMVNGLQNRGEDVVLCFVEKDVEKEKNRDVRARQEDPPLPVHTTGLKATSWRQRATGHHPETET